MIGLALTDGTGRVWDLTDPVADVVLMRGASGLGDSDMEPLTTDVQHGRRWDGWRATERTVGLPLFSSAPDQLRDFTAGTVPPKAGGSVCTLAATLPDSSRWELGLRRLSLGLDMDRDPTMVGGIKLATSWDADVFWSGPVWSGTWQAAAPASGSWLLGPGGGGVARLSAGHTLSIASATNAGDVRVWPVWTVVGPCTWLSVGVGDLQVSGSVTLGAGESLTIDTDPEDGQMAVHSSGADWTDRLDEVGFAPLEPGSNPLNVTMTGTGTVSMSFRPLRLALL